MCREYKAQEGLFWLIQVRDDSACLPGSWAGSVTVEWGRGSGLVGRGNRLEIFLKVDHRFN